MENVKKLVYVNSLITEQSIVMIFDEGTKICKQDHPNFAKVKSLILKGHPERALEAFDISLKLKRHSSGQFFVGDDGIVYLDDKNPVPMPPVLSKRVIQFAEANFNFQPLVNFWNNIQANPNPESVKDLYGFLEHNGIAITEDGCFCAYKGVNDDYTSTVVGVWEFGGMTGIWAKNENKSYDNTPGSYVSMPREKVDSNREVTCSSGLHVAAFKYASGFGAARLVLVKVNPMDVVSVPVDYNQEKMRTCAYEVLEDVTEELKTPIYGEIENYDDEDLEDQDYEETDEDDWNNTDKEEGADDDEENVTYNLAPDKSGRVCIPAVLVKRLGLDPGDTAYVYATLGTITITGETITGELVETGDGRYQYIVDKDRNIRLSKGCIDSSDILKYFNNIRAGFDNDEGIVLR